MNEEQIAAALAAWTRLLDRPLADLADLTWDADYARWVDLAGELGEAEKIELNERIRKIDTAKSA